MEELERIEKERYGLLALTMVVTLTGLMIAGLKWIPAVLLAAAIAMFVSGTYVAAKTTGDYVWSLELAEARTTGGSPSRRGVWLGNLLPALAVLAVGVWWQFAH